MKKIGLVGLPNSGKSSIFKLLTKRRDTLVANYCFSTMDKEIENFKIWDERIEFIASFFKNPKLVFSELRISDIPGIVKGAHKNKGLGSRFMSHIRECDLIIMMIRFFEDESIIHFEGKTDPLRDFDILTSELVLSDLEQIERALEKKTISKQERKTLENLGKWVSSLNFISEMKNLTNEEEKLIKNYNFLTNKPLIIVANVGEENKVENMKFFQEKMDRKYEIIPVNIKKELEKKDEDFKNKVFFEILKKNLEMKSFFTAGEKEVRSWTIDKNADAKECAGLIHSDIKNRLIRVNVLNEKDFDNPKDLEKKSKKEKKDYLVKDGDICDFMFN